MAEKMNILEAMGAKAIDKKDKKRIEKIENLFTNNEYVAQHKLNGERLMAFKDIDSNETVRLFGRGTSKYGERMEKTDLLDHIVAILDYLPSGTALDGEVVYMQPWVTFKQYCDEVTGKLEDTYFWKCREIMGSYPEKALLQQEEEGRLHYIVFDMLYQQGNSIINTSLELRDRNLKNLVQYNPEVFSDDGYIHYLPLVYGERAKRDMFETAMNLGREGVIFKKLNGIYCPGKKPTGQWVKLKRESDADGIIIGYAGPNQFTEITRDGKKVLDETGKPVLETNRFWTNNWIGSIWIGQYIQEQFVTETQFKLFNKLKNELPHFYTHHIKEDYEIEEYYHLVPVAKISGIDDNLRREISENPDKYLGKVVKFSYFEKTNDSYFQPRFECFRDDKPAKECLWED